MPDITREEFMARIGMDTPSPAAPAATNASSPAPSPEPLTVPPLTQEVLKEESRKLDTGRLVVSSPEKSDTDALLKLGVRPGVPFDSESGIPFMQRLRLTFQPTPEEEEKALKSAYPGGVRRNEFGWLIVTKPGKDGKPTDTLVDPVGAEIGDLASIFSELPSIVGGGLALKGAKAAPGILNAAKNLLRVTGGVAAGRVASDVVTRGLEGEPVDPVEITARRGEEAAIDLGMGTVLGASGKLLGMFISPFGNRGPLQFKGEAARQHLGQKTGVYLELTPAEMSGSQFLQRTESLEMNKPGASAAFDAIFKRKQEQIGEIQKIILGGAVPDEELAAQKAMAALGAKTAPLEQNIQRATGETVKAAESELTTGIGSSIDKTSHGAAIRAKAEEVRSSFQAQSKALYDEVFSDPLTQAKNIPGTPLAKESQALIKELPSVENRLEKIAYDAYGSPVSVISVKNQPLKEFVPANVLPKLEALTKGSGQNFRLDELMAMRREVDNDIALGESIPGVQTRYLSKIRGMLTERIKTGLEKLSPELLTKWETANSEYAKGVAKFKKSGITELFKDPEQPGFLSDTAIVERVTGGGQKAQDTYRAYKEFFGAGSPEIQGVQQAIRDDVFGRDRIEGLVDAKGFISRITSLAKDAPDAYTDAFGSSAAALRNSARALRVARGDTLPEEELIKAVQSGNFSATKLSEMLSAQQTKTTAYRNELVKAISEGNLKPDSIKPTELVNRLVFQKDTQPAHLKDLVSYIHDRPDVLEDLRRLTFKRALDESTIVHKQTGTRILSGDDLESLLGDENMTKRIKTMLGNDTYQDLVAIKDVLKMGSAVQSAAKTAGGLQAGTQIAGLVESGAFKYVDRAAKNFIIAEVYTDPKIKALVTNSLLTRQDKVILANAMAVSAPFVHDLIKYYGDAGARRMAESVKGSIDRFVREGGGEGAGGTGQKPSREEFLRRLGAGQ